MAINPLKLTRGFGNGVFSGTIARRVMQGFEGIALSLSQADLDAIANAVWSELRVGYTNSATFGGFTQSKLLTVAKWLGLR